MPMATKLEIAGESEFEPSSVFKAHAITHEGKKGEGRERSGGRGKQSSVRKNRRGEGVLSTHGPP